jgi:lysophospholipase L1-like esterase
MSSARLLPALRGGLGLWLVCTAAPHLWGTAARNFDLTRLTATDTYTPERGHGFDLGTAPTADGRPFFFSVAVPEGNHRVTVTFGAADKSSVNTVKAESRRLMLASVPTAPGETLTRSFLVNVRNPNIPPPAPNAPGGTAVVLNEREAGSLTWDDRLTLEFNGAAPAVRTVTIAPAEVPTVFLLGDSTVTDQRWEDGASWGQLLTACFAPTVAIANHAESGETLKSFLTGLRLAKVLSQLKAGDWVFIQFGHNDQKQNWPQTYADAATTYPAYLRAYLAEVRLRGATPVLVTSPQRRTFDDRGRIRNTHGDYPAAVRAVAAAEQVALIDLDRASTVLYEALGPAESARLFADGGRDATHHNALGAALLACAVAQGLRDANLPLAAHLAADLPAFDSAQPGDLAAFAVPASPLHRAERPRGN